jgi:hypothetical protein
MLLPLLASIPNRSIPRLTTTISSRFHLCVRRSRRAFEPDVQDHFGAARLERASGRQGRKAREPEALDRGRLDLPAYQLGQEGELKGEALVLAAATEANRAPPFPD